MTIDDIKAKLAQFAPIMDGICRARQPHEIRQFVLRRNFIDGAEDRVFEYRQALIELDAKHKALLGAERGIRLKRLEIEELELKRPGPATSRLEEIAHERLDLDVDRIEQEIHDTEVAMRGALKEVVDFISIIESDYADLMPLTEEQLLEHEQEYWEARFTKQCLVDMLASAGPGFPGRIGEGNRAALMSMPQDVQERVLYRVVEMYQERAALEQGIAQRAVAAYRERTQEIAATAQQSLGSTSTAALPPHSRG